MTQKVVSGEKIIKWLRKYKVTQTYKLAKQFNCSCRTIFRKLGEVGYLTSYNMNGSGLTLEDIPDFDRIGLWKFKEFRFSRWGTIKHTIKNIVEMSRMGMQANELQTLLGTAVYHHISSCVNDGMVYRDLTLRFPVYYSMDPQTREKQRTTRTSELQKIIVPRPSPISKEKIIQILVAVIKYRETSAEKLMFILESEGLRVSEKSIKWVFDKYDIEKKGSLSGF